MPIAYSYLRFSTPDQAKGDSTRRQTELAERYAAKHGLTLNTNLRMTDEGISAFRAKNMKIGALGRFVRALQDGLVEEDAFLLVENLDRVSRANPWDAMATFKQIIDAGVTIVTLQDERVWNQAELRGEPFRIFESLFVMIRANQESELKSRRLKSAWENKRKTAGTKAMTSRVPAWLRLDRDTGTIVVDQEKAAVVNRIYELTVEGWGKQRITELLNKEGVPRFGGAAHWQRSYVAKLLQNSAVIGTLVPHEMVYDDDKRQRKALQPIKGYYPPIVPEPLFYRAQAQHEGNRGPAGRKGTVANFLAGLARCPACEASMTRVVKGAKGGKPYLVCTRAKVAAGCTYRAVRLPEIEDALIQNVGWMMSIAPSGDDSVDARLQQIDVEMSVLSEQVNALVGELAAGPSPAIRTKLAEQEAALEALKEEEQRLWGKHEQASSPYVQRRMDDLLEALEATPPDPAVVNARLRQVFSKITVDYRAGSLDCEWRQGGTTSIPFAWPEENLPSDKRAVEKVG